MTLTEKIIRAKTDYDDVHKAGKDQMLSDMWDMIQGKGARTNYMRTFCNSYISKDKFKPNFDFKFSNSQYLFLDARGDVLDLDAIEKECGIVFDFSEATTINATFQYAPIEKVNVIDGSKGTSLNYFFCGANSSNPHPIKWVNKFIVNPEATFSNSFNWCSLLEHIIFEGTIGKSGLTLSHCTLLDRESLLSVINCLEDKTGDTSGTTWKVTFGSTNIAKLTTEELQSIEDKGWTYA